MGEKEAAAFAVKEITRQQKSDEAHARYKETCSAFKAGQASWDDVVEHWNDVAIAEGRLAGLPMPHEEFRLNMSTRYEFDYFHMKSAHDMGGDARNQGVELLAYYLWEDAGRPDGQDKVHWQMASRWYTRSPCAYWRHHRRKRFRAYFLWINAGCPLGREKEFWHEATEQLKEFQPEDPYTPLTLQRDINSWDDRKRGRRVVVTQDLWTGRASFYTRKINPVTAVSLFYNLIKVSSVWSLRAEEKAQQKLKSMVSEMQYRHYMLTGMFREQSKRSGVEYIFRKSRPTIAMRLAKGRTRILCCLCTHSVGYYQGTWGGVLPPTDDIISHLLLMRHDEPKYWKVSEQHKPDDQLAGVY